MRRCGSWLGALIGLLLVQTAAGDQVADGLAAWQAGVYGQAHEHWEYAAEAGDAQAMFLLSELLAHGQGVLHDPARALSWLQAAAEAGYPPACYNLGDRYLNGEGAPRDPALAAHWWRQAAVRGLPLAQYNLGTLYYRGLGVPADPAQAAWWYRQAARQGSDRARKALMALARAGVETDDAVGDTPTPGEPPEASRAEGLPGTALGSAWLKRQPPGYFTVQVFASKDRQAVERFLRAHRLSRQVAVYPFRKGDAVWYGVVYGRFASAKQARAAVTELPEPVRRGGPWVRRLGELTAIITEVGQSMESS